MSHFTIWGIPFHHLGYPILPFGVSHFTIWDVPFHHLGCPISPFGVSHFTIWGIAFPHLGYPISPFGVSHFTIWDVLFCHLGCPISPFGVYFGTFVHNPQPRCPICLLRFFAAKYVSFSLSVGKIDLAPFCIFVILCFCIFAFCKCETASVRQLKQVSLRSLTRIFDESGTDMTKDTSKLEGWGCGRESDEGAKRKNGR